MSTNIVNQIMEYELTRSQLRIASYIARNQKRILGMTSKQLGKEVGVSDATIIRFARTVGFEGYTDLQEQLKKEMQEQNEKIGKHSLHDRYVMQFQRYEEGEHFEKEMLQLMEMNLETSIRQNDAEIYRRIVSGILGANRKVVIGLRGGKGPAVQFTRLLGLITSRTSMLISEGHDEISSLTDLDAGDVAVYLNFPRYFTVDEKIAGILVERKVPIYLITDSMMSPVAKYAREILLVETEHYGFFHSMIGVEGVLEYLLVLMCRQRPDVFRKRLEDRDYVWEEYLSRTQMS